MTKKLIPAMILLAVFVVLSFQFINAPLKKSRPGYRSTELKRTVTKNGNVTRTYYTDEDGNPQIAANVGYATRITVQQEDSETETFLDDRGERIRQYYGYFGILREYDSKGNNIRITYLDENNDPMVILLNYAVEERDYNEAGQQISCRYLDTEGKSAFSHGNGFGARYEYDDKGRKVKTTYLDDAGEPMNLYLGYSSLVREYYETDGPENGRVKREFYFLSDGQPASLSLGQYGVYNEYDRNGQVSLVTYLDAGGSPMVTNKGYTSAAYTYFADNTVQSTLYYDINGNPFRMGEGQYGTKIENGQTILLNADGTEQFSIRNYVYNHSELVIIISVMLVLLSSFAGRKTNWLMLILYVGVIMYFTLMFRETGESQISALRSYRRIFVSTEARAEILKNIWLFVPLGAILFRICPRKAILGAIILFSVIIEAVQYFTGMGFCELSDVISNGLGGAIGYGMGCLMQVIRKELHRGKAHVLNS